MTEPRAGINNCDCNRRNRALSNNSWRSSIFTTNDVGKLQYKATTMDHSIDI